MKNSEFNPFGQGIQKSNAGFTLIEMVVTVLVFSMLMMTIVAIFSQAIRVERQAVIAQRIQDNATFVLEAMAKEIRVSDIVNQDSPCSATTLTMNHPALGNIVYSLTAEGNVQRQGYTTSIVNSTVVQFTRLNFCISGSGTNDDHSVRVTVIMSLKNRTGVQFTSVDIQTTVASRNIISELKNP